MLPGSISNLARVRFPPSGTAPGNVDGPASSTDNAIVRFSGSTGKLLKDSPDFTYSTPTLSVPDAFNVSSAGSISLTAGGSNKNITATPNGTGAVTIPVGGATGYGDSPFVGLRVISSGAIESGFLVDGYGDGATNRFVGRLSGGTPGSPTALATGRTIVGITARGYDGTSFSGTSGSVGINSAEAWSNSAHGTNVAISYVPKGTTVPKNAIRVQASAKGMLSVGEPSNEIPIDVTALTSTSVGIQFSIGESCIYKDTTTPTGTLAQLIVNSVNPPTLRATNTSVVYTNAANLYIGGDPAAGTNVTLTNSYGLWNVGKTRLDGNISSYGGVATAGAGAVVVRAAGRVTAQSAANASISTFTVGASDGSFEVSANMNVTAAVALATTLTCTYTDESNTARTMILPVLQLAGSFIAAGAITGTGAWETPTIHIRCKAATAITILTSAGTFTTVTYTAEGIIKQTS